MKHLKSVFIVLSIFGQALVLTGQETPINPISYRVFDPFVLNPAIAGSKDYFLVNGITTFQGTYASQLISFSTRLNKKAQGFFSYPVNTEYSNFGIGGTFFNDICDSSKSIGFSFASDYHISLNKQSTSFISFGLAVKGVYNRLYSFSPADTAGRPQKKFLPNFDLGAYYYGPRFYLGLSATNLLGSEDTLGLPVKPEYFFTAGYKFIISRALNFVIEPSLIAHTGDSLPDDIKDIFNPMVKIYIQNFCAGTYFNDYDDVSFFFRYNFPTFSLGAYFEYPSHTAFYKKELKAELTLGLNLSNLRSRNRIPLHW